MIESRYTIEYIDPSSEKSPSKLGRFFIYSTLTISILAAIVALIYSNLPNSTSQVIVDKAQQFISYFNEPTKTAVEKENIVSESETPIVSTKAQSTQVDKDKLAQQKLIATQLEDKYKKEIERLIQENKTQHNKTVKHLTANQSLTKKLDALSKQLKNEVQKNLLLKKEVTSLEADNKTTSTLLKKSEETAKNYADEIKALKKKEIKIVEQPKIVKPVNSEPVELKPIELQKEEPEVVTTKEIKTKETSKSAEDTSTINENKAPTSQMDAIVATMEAAKSTSNTQNADPSSATKK